MTFSPRDRAEAPTSGERALVRAAVGGDGLAFRRLVEPHLPMLYRIAARVSGNPQLAEDAVQETLTLAYRRLASYQHTTAFRAFLAAVAARQAHTLARAERRRARRERVARAPQHPHSPEQELQAAQMAAQIRQALAAMPSKRRAAALLRLDAGLSYRDVAVALDSTEGSARVLVHKALAELRRSLADLLQRDLSDEDGETKS